jgi:hypothetical protein
MIRSGILYDLIACQAYGEFQEKNPIPKLTNESAKAGADLSRLIVEKYNYWGRASEYVQKKMMIANESNYNLEKISSQFIENYRQLEGNNREEIKEEFEEEKKKFDLHALKQFFKPKGFVKKTKPKK